MKLLDLPPLVRLAPLVLIWIIFAGASLSGAPMEDQLEIRVSWGQQTPSPTGFYLRLVPRNILITNVTVHEFEPGDRVTDDTWQTQAGGGDVDAAEFELRFPKTAIAPITNLHRIWADLLRQSDPDTAQRLQQDPAYRPDSRLLAFQMDPEGTKGFSVTVDQLLRQRALWVPVFDIYIAAGGPLLSFSAHQAQLASWRGFRILDQVQHQPEATYEEFTRRWEDMGSPSYKNPAQTGPGHIVGITWDSALYKFGIDRGAGVCNDYGNPERFHLWLDFADVAEDLSAVWKGQRLVDGLPILLTDLSKEQIGYHLEQFAYPLNGRPRERHGDIPMVLLQKCTLTNLTDQARSITLGLRLRRLLPDGAHIELRAQDVGWVLGDSTHQSVLLSLQGDGLKVQSRDMPEVGTSKPERAGWSWRTTEVSIATDLEAHGSRGFVLKLPSPVLSANDEQMLLWLDYATARKATLDFWSGMLSQGARFNVPEPAVNELFRANLWHALRLPRRHGGTEPGVRIDLPYSNFAYDQKGTPWPVNQSVYVDYMIYDLRGYHAMAAEELGVIYRNNQETNGHVAGYANWGVYTPAMIYSVAQNYLLSGDRAAFETLLPQTLNALDWCLAQIQKGADRPGPAKGLVRAPLNDGTGDGVWAFNQAYFYAGLDRLAQALQQIAHPRAQQCREAANAFRRSIQSGFGAATMCSPLVQLRGHTWMPYVPCEVLTPHRLMQIWYPTDVDTGATHLPRLQATAPEGQLADFLLNDHEDNLYLHHWGMANEPVYNQQATAYLLRDNPKAVIRAFYSMTACAFSHTVFEPVEHRWTWGQYFGPPSTDGAWFELYRQMLIRETADGGLLLCQATPRRWLEDGKKIEVQRAPTYYGECSFSVESETASGKITARFSMAPPQLHRSYRAIENLVIRLRHPQKKQIRAVTVNDQRSDDFDRDKEWIWIRDPRRSPYVIVAQY